MICFDLDGVIVKYDFDGYNFDKPGGPDFLKPGYFCDREEDTLMVKVFKKCLEMFPQDTYIITSVPDCERRNSIVIDKLQWLDKHIPEFDIGSRFIASTSNKMSIIEWIRGSSINKRDILIDDWNINLYSWAARGGTAIKYLNGLNSKESWVGPTLHHNRWESEVFNRLADIILNTEV